MIPAALVGIFFNDEIESFFGGQIMLVGFMLLLTGTLLFLADKAKNTDERYWLWTFTYHWYFSSYCHFTRYF